MTVVDSPRGRWRPRIVALRLRADDRLAGQAARGDTDAFAVLYERHHRSLYRYCRSIVGDPDDEYRAHFWSNGNFAKARLKDPEIDQLIDSASNTYDPAVRTEQYKALQKMLFDKAVYGFLWTQDWNWVMSKRLQNVPAPMGSLWDFRKAWVAS